MKRTFAAAALVGLLGTGVVLPATAFAVDSGSSTTSATTQSGQRPARPTDAERKAKGQEILKALVTKGTITQAQADKIVAALEAARPARPADGQAPAAGQTKTTGQAPAAGQTTGGQAASGTNARTRPNPADGMKKVLATLVSNKTLTQAQSDAVVAAFEAARPARPAGAPQGQNRPQNAPTTSGATATRS